jgi:inositol transport system permease protein
VAGAFIIGFLENIMNLIGVDSYIQQIIEGLIVVIAVAADIFSKNRKVTKVIIAPTDDKDKKEKK